MLDLLGLFRKKQQPLTFSSIAFSRRGPWINRHDCKYFALFWSAEKAGWGSLTFRPDVSQVYARYRPFAPWLDQYLSGVHPLFCLIITDRNLAALFQCFLCCTSTKLDPHDCLVALIAKNVLFPF